MADFAEMNSVWQPWLDGDHRPARACTEAKMVIVNKGTIKVEIVVTAASDK